MIIVVASAGASSCRCAVVYLIARMAVSDVAAYDFEPVVTAALRRRAWECVVIGGGLRKEEEQLEMFERLVNLVRRHAPTAALAFNSTPTDTFDAAARWIDTSD